MTKEEARRRRALARWHRRLAAVAGLWLIVLAITGVLINHAHDWGLDRSPLPASLQRSVYGVEPRDDYCQYSETIGPDCRAVFAELKLPSGALLLGPSRAWLLDDRGRLIEAPTAAQFGLEAFEAGLAEGERVFLRGSGRTVLTDAALLEWEMIDAEADLSPADASWQIRTEAAAVDLSWERLLLDLHAARFLGPSAWLANDLLAGLILVLGLTGGWLYLVKRRRN